MLGGGGGIRFGGGGGIRFQPAAAVTVAVGRVDKRLGRPARWSASGLPSCITVQPLHQCPGRRRSRSTVVESVPQLHPAWGAPSTSARFSEMLFRTKLQACVEKFTEDAGLCTDFFLSMRCGHRYNSILQAM